MLRSYSPIGLTGPVQQLQAQVAKAIEPVLSKPQLDSVLLESLPLLEASTTRVEHGLGREPRGWHVARQSAGAMVWEQTAATDAKYLALRCSDNVTVSLVVF